MKRIVVALLVLTFSLGIIIPAAQASILGDVFKVGAIGLVIDKFSKPLNSFINTLTAKHGASSDYATKVVPILTVGTGGYIGAAQVIGPQDLVDATEAILQLEGDFNGRQFRVKALIPIDSKNPVKFNRVNGVGVSAIIDVRI